MATSTLGSGTLVLAGTTSGTTTVTATAVAGTTTLTLPAATDTLVGKATTDTLTNKTLTSPTLTGVATFAAGTAAAPAITTTGDTNTGIWFPAADTIAFTEGGVESMRIDASGNLGLGVTPSAWSSASRPALQLPNGAAFFSRSAATALSQNVFYNSIDDSAYIANGFATLYYQTSGQHQWYTAPSNSSGAGATPISFTQAMTLDASGNLGIGTSLPNSRLQVSNSTVSTNAIAQFTNGTTGTSAGNGLYVGIDSTNEATVFNFHNSPIKFGTNGTERARFNTTGAFVFAGGTTTADGIGITFPATQSASANANTLDDYEEGTFTPTIGGSSTDPSAIVYGTQSGGYTKIGNVVYIRFRVGFSFTVATGSGSLQIRGLPFTSASGVVHPKSTPQQDNITYTGFTYLEMGANDNATSVGLAKNRSGNTANGVAIGDCASGGTDINGGFFYFV